MIFYRRKMSETHKQTCQPWKSGKKYAIECMSCTWRYINPPPEDYCGHCFYTFTCQRCAQKEKFIVH